MSKIEDLVIFKNEKELSETEKSIEKIFEISFQSYVRRLPFVKSKCTKKQK